MFFNQLSLTGFKNYTSKTFAFEKRIVGICGLNGKGKTNLLDALYYLCFTKSYFSRSDQMNVHFGEPGFRLQAYLDTGTSAAHTITCIFRGNAKKEFLLDDIPYEKFSHHIGKFPCVFVGPDDIALITGGSEERRKFLDTLISQVDVNYLQNLILYNKVLAQRNGLLKYEAQRNTIDPALMDAIDERFVTAGVFVHQKRKEFCEKLFPLILQFYDSISGSAENIRLEYDSQLTEGDFRELLRSGIEKDRYTLRTNTGIHKDDIGFQLFSNAFRQTASQGQKKSLLFACRLAEFDILKQEKDASPFLLLDDVFEKLDELRVQNLLQFIIGQNDGQVFITDTNSNRLKKAIAHFHDALQIIQLD